jgi:hypothetical protein
VCMLFLAAVLIAVEEEEAVVFRWPASKRALELILSLRGLVGLAGGERCWEGATVRNVTADCLPVVGRGKGCFNRGLSFWAGQSRSSD